MQKNTTFFTKKNVHHVKQFLEEYVCTSFTCLMIFLVSDFSVKSWSDRLIVNRLKKSRTFPNSKQWAAVTTHWFEIKDPPQKWSPENMKLVIVVRYQNSIQAWFMNTKMMCAIQLSIEKRMSKFWTSTFDLLRTV